MQLKFEIFEFPNVAAFEFKGTIFARSFLILKIISNNCNLSKLSQIIITNHEIFQRSSILKASNLNLPNIRANGNIFIINLISEKEGLKCVTIAIKLLIH